MIACAYETKGSRILSRGMTGLFLAAVCVYVAAFYRPSVLLPAILMSAVAYYLIGLAHPPRAIAVGEDWLSVQGTGKKRAPSWIRTTGIAELRRVSKADTSIELRDNHGRTVSVRLGDLRANQMLYAVFMHGVRRSDRAGMRIDERVEQWLQLDMPLLGDEISLDEDGNAKVTYFAVHLVADGPNNPISVIRRTPGDPLPTDESSDGNEGWKPAGYLYHFLGIPQGFAFTKISERQALAFAAPTDAPGDHTE